MAGSAWSSPARATLEIDDHHSVEDIGIALGQAFKQALGDKAGIIRFGDATIPMDDALTMVAIDLSGRPFYKYTGPELNGSIGTFSEELTDEFLRAFAMNAGVNLHVTVFYGQNKHHVHETIFKALGIALHKAAAIDESLGRGRSLRRKERYDHGHRLRNGEPQVRSQGD